MSKEIWKEDRRPKLGGWAPGTYFCACQKCGDDFVGDKRAIICADCAYATDSSLPPAKTED